MLWTAPADDFAPIQHAATKCSQASSEKLSFSLAITSSDKSLPTGGFKIGGTGAIDTAQDRPGDDRPRRPRRGARRGRGRQRSGEDRRPSREEHRLRPHPRGREDDHARQDVVEARLDERLIEHERQTVAATEPARSDEGARVARRRRRAPRRSGRRRSRERPRLSTASRSTSPVSSAPSRRASAPRRSSRSSRAG